MARLFEDCFRNPFYSKIWLFLSLLAFFAIRQTSSLIATHNHHHHHQSDRISRSKSQRPQTGSGFSWQIYSDWSGFGTVDDEEESVDNQEYAREEDSFEKKAKLGSMIPPPTIEMNADPIFVPTGSRLQLDVLTVLGVLSACRQEIATMFGYTEENRGVGITGGIDFVDLDGPIVCLAMKGRFWHEDHTVMQRVKTYLMSRIPEIVDVVRVDEDGNVVG